MLNRLATTALACLLLPVSPICVADDLTVGSLNIEWFGHGNKPRTQEQIERLARYIKSLEVDVLACQEISPRGDRSGNGTADWQDLLAEIGPGFDAWNGNTGGSQRLAFIWRTDRVEVSDKGELRGIARQAVPGTNKQSFPRIPLTVHVKSKAGGVDFRLITVHLYFTSDAARFQEATQLNSWVQGYLAGPDDKDVLLIGDCNTKPMGAGESGNSQAIANLEQGGRFTCVSKDHDEYTTPTSEERYDHAFLSADLLNSEYVTGSWDVRREVVDAFPDEYKRDISNHVPVVLRIKDVDNDNEPSGDWGDQ